MSETTPETTRELELETTAMAVGGEAVARDESGRVVFVAGALPGERVRAEMIDERKTFARGVATVVLTAAPGRVEPPCPHVAEGCGGCDWQHATLELQRELRRATVLEVLVRQGGIEAPMVAHGLAVPAAGIRTTVRGTAGPGGRFAFRRRRSHDPVEVGSCLVAHPLVEEIVTDGRFGAARDVTIRVGSRTGDRMVIVGPTAADVAVPADVQVIGRDELASGRRAWLHEEAAGRRWRISADSFFQASPEGAEALVVATQDLLATHADQADHLVDLCCGVGLFAGSLAAEGTATRVLGVERSASAVADARHNLADRDARIVKAPLERWRPSAAEIVVADPARQGLKAEGVAAVAATGAELCVLVSCDPGALGRDAALLRKAGYHHVGSTLVDLFGHTSNIEVVSGFVKHSPLGT